MNRILLASVAVLSLVGAAAGEGAPALYGSNYSANVLQTYNGSQSGVAAPRADTLSSTVSTRSAQGYSSDFTQGAQQKRPSDWEVRSGR